MSLKVGIYNEDLGGGIGGAESVMAVLAEIMLSEGHDVEVLHGQLSKQLLRSRLATDDSNSLSQPECGLDEPVCNLLRHDVHHAYDELHRPLRRPPTHHIEELSAERKDLISRSPIAGKYEVSVDRESAYEVLKGKAVQAAAAAESAKQQEAAEKEEAKREKELAKAQAQQQKELERQQREADRIRRRYDNETYRAPRKRSSRSDTLLEAAAKSAVRSASSQVGRQIMRGILGSIFRG